MNELAFFAVLGVLVLAVPAFFIFGQKRGAAAELARQASSKSTAEETAKRIISDAEREVETSRKSAVISGKEEVMKLRETAEVELRSRRSQVEQEERRVSERESTLDRKLELVEQRDRDIGKRASDFGRREKLLQTTTLLSNELVELLLAGLQQLLTAAEVTGALANLAVALLHELELSIQGALALADATLLLLNLRPPRPQLDLRRFAQLHHLFLPRDDRALAGRLHLALGVADDALRRFLSGRLRGSLSCQLG